jgi:adenylate kinase
VPEEELVRRLASRKICSNCGTGADPFGSSTTCKKCGGRLVQRTDDGEAVVLQRLKIYHRDTKPVLDFYRLRATFRTVDGAQAPEIVARQLDAMIDEAARGSAA